MMAIVDNTYKARICLALILLIFCSEHAYAWDAKVQGLIYPVLVNKFYTANHQQLFWLNPSASSNDMKALLLQKLDSSQFDGMGRRQYNYDQLLKGKPGKDSIALAKLDMLYTDAAIAYCKDLYQGYGIKAFIEYDEWSAKYSDKDNDFIIGHLAAVRSSAELEGFINSLEPGSKEYTEYKAELKKQYQQNDIPKAKQVAVSMNLYRWIYHFDFEKLIVVNIASATLKYYENNIEKLFSKMIVGKPSKKTPRFDATCKQVILYPYWNVPADIAMRELVPKYKRSPGLVDRQRMQVLNARGEVVNPRTINWALYSKSYFPYRLRQLTGCDNSLGIIKFDLTSPFGVYLHDTNEKGLFKSNNRYRSHGCMRVEKPLDLGNYLLDNTLDTTFLRACVKDVKPITVPLKKSVPVFVVYLTAEVTDSGSVNYYKDIYHLLH